MAASLNVRPVQISKQRAKDCPDTELMTSLLKMFYYLGDTAQAQRR